ncbi:MAG: hypothetical protein JSW06_04260 [Thermoplasmatales archaeon]|nr:MAG: hypothetical protein JSW06_04260 [Thermoplasmatales archaeon]
MNYSANISTQEFEKINSTVGFIQGHENNITSAQNIEEFTEVMVSIFEDENKSEYVNENYSFLLHESVDDECFDFLGGLSLMGDRLQTLLSNWSDGCDIWKYNSTTRNWTPLISDVDGADLPSGFNDTTNMCAGVMKVFNGSLYVGTWRAPFYGGCEVWRYNGSDWENVVGDEANLKGGFNNSKNAGAWSIEVFNDNLYIGTLNSEITDNGCSQIWRTQDGLNWTRVVNRGFRDSGANESVLNVYVWRMKEYNGSLYAGTFNLLLWGEDEHKGCQLFRSSSGDNGTWELVSLPGDNNGNGFGEPENYGIRMLKVYNNELYVGTAASVFQPSNLMYPEALEIWKYNGTNWTCIVEDNTGAPSNDPEYDGFGSGKNKYAFSVNVTSENYLWVGTFNGPVTIGCEVWRYNGTNWTAKVKDEIGEKSNGFCDKLNSGARSMIEYPTGSKKIVVGTFRGSTQALRKAAVEKVFDWLGINLFEEAIGGCQVWLRHGLTPI